MTTSAIRRLIRAAGREPVERDTLYNVVTGPEVADDDSRQSLAGSW
jgi:2-iminoacetate synthase ThiH